MAIDHVYMPLLLSSNVLAFTFSSVDRLFNVVRSFSVSRGKIIGSEVNESQTHDSSTNTHCTYVLCNDHPRHVNKINRLVIKALR